MHPLHETYTIIDAYLEQGKKVSAEQLMFTTCKKGCHWCCAEPLVLSNIEVDYLMTAIPPEALRGVKLRTAQWADKADKHPLLRQPSPSAVEYRALHLMCPLNDKGLCLVYDRRPYGCRAFLALRHPHLCSEPEVRQDQRFLEMPELAGMFLAEAARQSEATHIELDHLGSFLAKRLLNREVKTYYTD